MVGSNGRHNNNMNVKLFLNCLSEVCSHDYCNKLFINGSVKIYYLLTRPKKFVQP